MNVALATKIQELLVGNAAVVAICGTRSYGFQAPQGVTSPYNVLTEVVSVPAGETHGLDDDSEDDAEDTADETTIQINCYAATPATALALRSAVRKAIKKKRAMADVSVSRFDQRMFKEEQVELWNAQLDAVLTHNPAT